MPHLNKNGNGKGQSAHLRRGAPKKANGHQKDINRDLRTISWNLCGPDERVKLIENLVRVLANDARREIDHASRELYKLAE